MCKEDIAQVTDIDREAFPSQWPPANYKNELQNQLARYIVAYDRSIIEQAPNTNPEPVTDSANSGLLPWLKRVLAGKEKTAPPPDDSIAGFAGIWVMADEAHITNIAVRKRYQCQGIGELMLIHITELARVLKADIMTLEVRVSNSVAQSLYKKYGYTQVGVRRAYYTDNREDGVLMSTENINSEAYQAFFQKLKQAHTGRWGGPPQPC